MGEAAVYEEANGLCEETHRWAVYKPATEEEIKHFEKTHYNEEFNICGRYFEARGAVDEDNEFELIICEHNYDEEYPRYDDETCGLSFGDFDHTTENVKEIVQDEIKAFKNDVVISLERRGLNAKT